MRSFTAEAGGERMSELDVGQRAFSSFRVLNGEDNHSEREQLFRNMAQLFSFVSDRCNDEQVAQYDEVLCQLAELVEVEARIHVAKVLAPLARAPGTVIVKLANDDIEVAGPLLEFSNVLSDDDLIDIAGHKSEAHRLAIASRQSVTERVGEAIVEHGGPSSVARLVRNTQAELGTGTLHKLVQRASRDAELAADLRGRTDLDWASLRSEIDNAATKVLETLSDSSSAIDPVFQPTNGSWPTTRSRDCPTASSWTTARWLALPASAMAITPPLPSASCCASRPKCSSSGWRGRTMSPSPWPCAPPA
jgi:uncharacterized protein (DUF2336 family)